jgi:preprotein translocase subunit SecG
MQVVIQFLLIVIALFMIMLVLVQRGRGGGLAGALGGMGGQSAFGTKAGDMFTRITIVTAAVWILLCMYAVVYLNKQPTILPPGPTGVQAGPGSKTKLGTTPQGDKVSESKPAEGTKRADTKPAESKPAESSTPAESSSKKSE